MKNELEVERIFACAEALEKTGRQKNMCFCWEDVIYILNADKTVLLRFETTEKEFSQPISFFVSDYDSSAFSIEENKIVFIQKGIEFDRRKRCGVPLQTFEGVEDMFYKFYQPDKFLFHVSFNKESLELLNPLLSHIEFLVKDKEIKIVQRDIYSGTVIELQRKLTPTGLGLMEAEDNLPRYLPVVGMRTNDFFSLFNFNDKIKIYIPEQAGYFIVEGAHNNMLGVVSGCLYDEIGEIKDLQEEENGRKIEEGGTSEPEVNSQNQGLILRKRNQ